MNPLTIALVVVAGAAASAAGAAPSKTNTFEIASNKPFVRVSIGRSAPQWFILDSGCRETSMISRECADRLKIARDAGTAEQIGAGTGSALVARASRPLTLTALGDTLTLAEPIVVALDPVTKVEGRRIDGLLGGDFLARNVVEIDYSRRWITVHDPAAYTPPKGAVVVPLGLETGWPVVDATLTPAGTGPIPVRLIIDTGVRNTVTMFRPFSERHGLPGEADALLRDQVVGFGIGGKSRGDVTRVDALSIGGVVFDRPVAVFSRDTAGVFAMDGPDGIVGGELLRRHKVTFDYPHARMILEPDPRAGSGAFVHDMSGMFLYADGAKYEHVRVLAVHPGSPAAEAGLRDEDEIVSIDGRPAAKLGLDATRDLFRTAGTHTLEVKRGDGAVTVRLTTRPLV